MSITHKRSQIRQNLKDELSISHRDTSNHIKISKLNCSQILTKTGRTDQNAPELKYTEIRSKYRTGLENTYIMYRINYNNTNKVFRVITVYRP